MDRNQLDPSVPSTTEAKKIPLIIKVYAVLCTLSGVGTLPSVAVFMWQVITALINGNVAAKLGDNTLVAIGLIVAGIMLSAASAIILIVFGLDLIKDQRRNAARLSYVLIAFTVVELLVDVMLQGIGPFLLRPAVQLVILIALSATVDPTLRQERELQRRLQEMLDRDAAAIAVVDSNLHREHILPSEKAFAYKMKADALSHQGQRSDLTLGQVVPKSDSNRTTAVIGEPLGKATRPFSVISV